MQKPETSTIISNDISSFRILKPSLRKDNHHLLSQKSHRNVSQKVWFFIGTFPRQKRLETTTRRSENFDFSSYLTSGKLKTPLERTHLEEAILRPRLGNFPMGKLPEITFKAKVCINVYFFRYFLWKEYYQF